MNGTNGQPTRVLVVDDEDDVRFVLSMQLDGRNGLEVVGDAADGEQAVERCRELRPDAIVMDLLMPNVNGFEAIERIRAEFPSVGIVAYTGVAGDFVRQEMARLEVPLVLKTGDPTALIHALERVAVRE